MSPLNMPLRYLPFIGGVYSTAPGLKLTAKEPLPQDRFIFQVDDRYQTYLQNKQACRREDIHKYYLEFEPLMATMRTVNEYIVAKLVEEYPDHFIRSGTALLNKLTNREIQVGEDWLATDNTDYLSLFDALCNQVQEDVAVFQLTRHADYLAAIHLCAPNHWSPGEKIGKPFDQIHEPVAGMDQTMRHYRKILESIVYKQGPFTRFAWGLGSDERLNHHPQPPPGEDESKWQGRFLSENASAYLRVERQNLVGFPEVNAFLFTIRTYFYGVDSLSADEQQQLWQAVQSMTPESLKYKGLLNFARARGAKI